MASDSNDVEETRRLLRDSVEAFVAREGGIGRARACRDTPNGYDRDVWRRMAENGWLGLLLPEQVGGLGLGLGEMTVVAETLGRALAPEPVVPAVVLAGGVLGHGDNADLRATLLAGLIGGDILPALAWQETANEYDPERIETRAVADAGGVVLKGVKRFIPAAGGADGFIVSALGPDGLALYWIDAGAEGLELSLDTSVDGVGFGTLALDGVAVAGDRVVVADGAAAIINRAVDEARLCAAAALVGVMGQALDNTLDFVKQREQFGRPIGKFQALQHRLVDLWIQRELSRDSMAKAARCCDETGDPTRRAAAVSAAKARCGDAGMLICRQAIQLHGGIGYTDEFDIGLFLKRALVLSAWLGNAAMHRARFGRLAPDLAA